MYRGYQNSKDRQPYVIKCTKYYWNNEIKDDGVKRTSSTCRV